MMTVGVTEVGSINWLAWSNDGGKKVEVLSVVGAGGGFGFASGADGVGAVLGDVYDFKGATSFVGKFRDTAVGSVAVYSDAGSDKISNFEKRLVATGVDAFLMVGATILGENFEDFAGKYSLVLGEAEKRVNFGEVAINGLRW